MNLLLSLRSMLCARVSMLNARVSMLCTRASMRCALLSMLCARLSMLCAGLSMLNACSVPIGPAVPIAGTTGVSIRLVDIADECATHDVVFFGELHTSDQCHAQQLALLQLLHQRRPDLVLTMEMFDRDVQEVLDRYLAGDLAEAEFKRSARTWPNWKDYRQIVAFARNHRLPVLAANAPKDLVRKVSRGGGLAAIKSAQHVARVVKAPEDDAYFAAFAASMNEGDHGKMDPERVRLFYQAQCVRDDTMAETIADCLTSAHAEGRHPLVLHLCGSMHSDQRRGTVQRLLWRKPGLSVRVISSTSKAAAWFRAASGDYQLLVAPRPPKSLASPHKPGKPATTDVHAAKKTDPHAVQPDPHATAKAGTGKAGTGKPGAKAPGDAEARPGLGFKPGYEAGDEPGLLVEAVTEGGAADKAGMRDGDLLVELAGEAVEDIHGYMDIMGDLEVGQKTKAVVKRKGKKVALEIVVGRR